MNILIYTPVAFQISETFIQYQFQYQNKYTIIGIYHHRNDTNIPLNGDLIQMSAVPINFFDRVISFLQKKMKNLYRYSFSYITEKKIIKIIKEKKIDVIHCNYGTNALKFLNVIKKTGIPLIAHFHGFDASKSLNDPYYTSWLSKLFKAVSKVIVVSYDMQQSLLSFMHKEQTVKLEVIPYGVDFEKILTYPVVKKDKSIIKILHVGRLTPKKGVTDLIAVFHNVRKKGFHNIQLHIVGDGEEKPIIEKYINQNKLHEHIILYGGLSHSDVIKQIKESDIFVLNSRTAPDGDKEGFPNVIIEAMAAETAILSTFHAGIPMAIDSGIEGILVQEKNNNELEQAIIRMVSNADERTLFASNAKKKALSEFTTKKMIDNFNKVYESIKK